MSRHLTELEQDLLDACHDLHGGPQRSLQRLLSEVQPAALDDVLSHLVGYGLLRRERAVIGDETGVLEEDIWMLTPQGATQVSPG